MNQGDIRERKEETGKRRIPGRGSLLEEEHKPLHPAFRLHSFDVGGEGEPALIIRESRDKPPVVTTLPLVFFFFYSIFIFSFLFAFLVLVERVLVIF